jgi:hypothetical protein
MRPALQQLIPPGFANLNNYPYIKALADFDWARLPDLSAGHSPKSGGTALERLRWRLLHVCRIQAGPFS